MNIFEQYGIKEVANVTLYSIELDKNDNEIYIPIMYLDTLKVSSVEQSADQTSARGGIGNPELITWDFGKTISVTLEDALFTPASQSLMWGGKFGLKNAKIYGVWNPYIYNKDSTGRQQYIKRVNVPTEDFYSDLIWHFYHLEVPNKYYGACFATIDLPNQETLQYDAYIISSVERAQIKIDEEMIDGWKINVSLDDEPYVFYGYYLTIGENHYLHIVTEFDVTQNIPLPLDSTYDFTDLYYFICPCDGEVKWIRIEDNDGHYKYYREQDSQGNWGAAHWTEDQLVLTEYSCPKSKPIQESEEIETIIGKYELYKNFSNIIVWANNKWPERATLAVKNFGNFEYTAYEFLSDSEDSSVCYYNEIDNINLNAEKCTIEHIDAYGYTWKLSDLQMVSYEGNQDSYYLENTDLRYRIRTDNGIREVSLEYNSDNENNYQEKIDIYKNIKLCMTIDGDKKIITKKVFVGTFYIINDWNLTGAPPQDFIHEINPGINNVDMLERLEKCIAKQTFAINTDKNLTCNNYWYMEKYDSMSLTVFIDPKTMKPFESNANSYITKSGLLIEGNLTIIKQNQIYYQRIREKAPNYMSLGQEIVVDANHFPGTYKLVGETFAREKTTGQDFRYQFEIPLCKMSSSNHLTLSSEGEPTTFTMTLKVLRKDDGTMIKLTKYNTNDNNEIISTERLKEDKMDFTIDDTRTDIVPDGRPYFINPQHTLHLINPSYDTLYTVDTDFDEPYEGEELPYLQKADLNDLTIQTIVDPQGNIDQTVDMNELDKSQILVKRDTTGTLVQDLQEVYVQTGEPTGREIPPAVLREMTEKVFLSPEEYEVSTTKVEEEMV